MLWSPQCHTVVVVVASISLLWCTCVQSEQQPHVVDDTLGAHDISVYVNRKQCHNYFDVTGVTREAITACMLPIFNTTVSRMSRGTVDGQTDSDSGAVSWIQKCYDTLPDRGQQTTSTMDKTWRMGTNVVIHKPNIYVDVVKSGSESVRHMLITQGAHKKWGHKINDRSYSRGITQDQRAYFIWSLVRDPVPRFLSSFQQAVKQRVCRVIGLEPEHLAGSQMEQQRCFDWCISQLLQGNIVNEHFQTQSFRLLTQDSENRLLDYTFVGQLETVEEYWPNLFQHLFKGTNISTHGSDSMPHRLHHGIDVKVNILPWHVIALCNYYAQDFVCFNYELPTVCGGLHPTDTNPQQNEDSITY